MNEFRAKLLGMAPTGASLLKAKGTRKQAAHAAEDESFSDLTIPRDSVRQTHQRDEDRHRLPSEQVAITHDGEVRQVTLVNLSGGGAMIEGAAELKLWDRVELHLDDHDRLEAIVRWIKGGRIGLEFAHETRIDAEPAVIADMLRSTLERSFSDVAIAAASAPTADEEADTVDAGEEQPAVPSDQPINRSERRHSLIWTGEILYNHDSMPARLRNISSGGALVETPGTVPVGSELMLDLGEAGYVFATVTWARGDQLGLRFHTHFDVAALAKVRPELTGAQWVVPDYLRLDKNTVSPWADRWERVDLRELHDTLHGYTRKKP